LRLLGSDRILEWNLRNRHALGLDYRRVAVEIRCIRL
jgi:hypothetical protein